MQPSALHALLGRTPMMIKHRVCCVILVSIKTPKRRARARAAPTAISPLAWEARGASRARREPIACQTIGPVSPVSRGPFRMLRARMSARLASWGHIRSMPAPLPAKIALPAPVGTSRAWAASTASQGHLHSTSRQPSARHALWVVIKQALARRRAIAAPLIRLPTLHGQAGANHA